MTTGSPGMKNWLKNVTWQTQFSLRSHGGKRADAVQDWAWYERVVSYRRQSIRRRIKNILATIGWSTYPEVSLDWLHTHVNELWETRLILADDLSRLLFDMSLVLRMTSHRQFYFPRIDFEDLATVVKIEPFDMDGLPRDYLGSPLRIYDLILNGYEPYAMNLRVIGNEMLVDYLNNYRQYLITRNGTNVSPRNGDVVLDCGACIGDFSVLSAAMVGEHGQVHAFDPIPLHNRYCKLQALLNPALAHTMHFNTLAVGARSSAAKQAALNCDQIDPGHRVDTNSFDFVSLDDYAKKHLQRVDFVKMDIEGAEMDALAGAEDVICTFKPRLAISGYHRPSDLWEIPQKIMSFNPGYKLTFGHHSPVQWESVFYAVHQN